MIDIGTVFRFIGPEGWKEFRDGNRYVFHGLNREELIVSAYLVQGSGMTNDPELVQQRLFRSAEQSVKNAMAHPALQETQPFQRVSHAHPLECWTARAETKEGDTLFCQAVFRNPRGVLLATFEAPNTVATAAVFEEFVGAVRTVSESEIE